MWCGSTTTLSQHHHHLLPKTNSLTSHSCHSFPFTHQQLGAALNCIGLWMLLPALVAGSEKQRWEWKAGSYCGIVIPNEIHLPSKRYMWLLFLPFILTLQPTGLTLPAKMVHATLLPSPKASSLGWASQHITFPFDPAAHERGCCVATQVPYLPLLNNQREKNIPCDCTVENCIENCIFCTCSDGQMKALQISFSSSPPNSWVFVCIHFFSASVFPLWYNYAYTEYPLPLCKITDVAIPG